jgi:hypothetical protein
MQRPVALSMNGALRKILHTRGSKLTWIAQRQHVPQIPGGMDTFLAGASFMSAFGQDSNVEEPELLPWIHPLLGPSQGKNTRQNQWQDQGQPPGLNPDWHTSLVLGLRGGREASFHGIGSEGLTGTVN